MYSVLAFADHFSHYFIKVLSILSYKDLVIINPHFTGKETNSGWVNIVRVLRDRIVTLIWGFRSLDPASFSCGISSPVSVIT